MTNKTLDQLSSIVPPLVDTDIVPVLRSASGSLTSVAWSIIKSTLLTWGTPIFGLLANNLSDLPSPASARTNLGLGIASTANYQPVKTVSGKPVDNNNDVDVPFFRNRLINGDMRIDQRRAGASVTPTSGAYITDRWTYDPGQASKMTLGQNLNAVALPAGQGFTKYLGAQTASAYTPAAGESFALRQTIEGQNLSDLMWGTASAKAITVTFWAYSSLTGTFGCCVRNGANTRSYPFTYNLASANTWTSVTVTIPGDTSGTWSTDNTAGLHFFFGLGVGATLSGAAGSWAGASYVSATGAVSVVGTLNATFYVTGVQLESGSLASAFERRPFATELMLCQRYFEIGGTSAVGAFYSASNASPVTPAVTWGFQVTKRASPTIAAFNAGPWSFDDAGIGTAVMTSPSLAIQRISSTATRINLACASSTGVYTQYHVAASGGDYFSADAEL